MELFVGQSKYVIFKTPWLGMRAAEADSVQVHGRRGKDATMTDAPLFPAPQSTRFRI